MSFTLSHAKLALAGATAIATLGAAAGGAQAATKPLTYTGDYPLIGTVATTITTKAALPETVKAGVPTAPLPISTNFIGGWEVAALFNLTASVTVDGVASVDYKVTGPSGSFTITVPETISTVQNGTWPTPAVLKASGTVPSRTFTTKGRYTVSQLGATYNLLARDASGTPLPIGATQPGPSSDADLENSFDVQFILDPQITNSQIGAFTVVR